MDSIVIQTEGREIEADLADHPLYHFKGMRFRTEGKMLFVFSNENRAAIDMVCVPKSLELYFLNDDKDVVKSCTARPLTPNPMSWRLYRPEEEYKYLLESFEPLGLEEGDKVDFEL